MFFTEDELDFTMLVTVLIEGDDTYISITLKCLSDAYQWLLETKEHIKPRNFLKDARTKEKNLEV